MRQHASAPGPRARCPCSTPFFPVSHLATVGPGSQRAHPARAGRHQIKLATSSLPARAHRSAPRGSEWKIKPGGNRKDWQNPTLATEACVAARAHVRLFCQGLSFVSANKEHMGAACGVGEAIFSPWAYYRVLNVGIHIHIHS